VLTKNAFRWDSARDVHSFRGFNQSFILENKIALEHGYANKKEIYKEMAVREKILQKMLDLNITSYRDVNKVLCDYYEKGIESLPFVI
jgi:flagellar protein FlaI